MSNYGKKPNIGCLFYSAIIVIVIIVAIIASIVGAVRSAESARYQEAMDGVLEYAGNQVTGSLMVAYDEEDQIFSKAYIPENLIAENTSEVRYILYFKAGEIMTGVYSNGAGSGYQRTVSLRIHDLKTGKDIAAEEFFGSDPPNSITTKANEKPKKVYGSYPDTEKIQAWILEVIG